MKQKQSNPKQPAATLIKKTAAKAVRSPASSSQQRQKMKVLKDEQAEKSIKKTKNVVLDAKTVRKAAATRGKPETKPNTSSPSSRNQKCEPQGDKS